MSMKTKTLKFKKAKKSALTKENQKNQLTSMVQQDNGT